VSEHIPNLNTTNTYV